MDKTIYPTFETHNEKGILPRVFLPEDYKELVKKFYAQERKKGFIRYAEELGDVLVKSSFAQGLEIRLQWDTEKGLTNISLGAHPGFDLNDEFGMPHFQEHNLGMKYSFIAGAIAMKYVSELLKSR